MSLGRFRAWSFGGRKVLPGKGGSYCDNEKRVKGGLCIGVCSKEDCAETSKEPRTKKKESTVESKGGGEPISLSGSS